MADPVLSQAMAKITGFGPKASPPAEDTQSTQYTDTFDDILQTDLYPTTVQGPISSSEHDTANPTEAASMTQSTRTDDPAPTVPGLLSFPRELESSPAHGFSYGKPVKPTINIRLTKGPAAMLQKTIEQQKADINQTPTLISNIASTAGSIPTTSQPEGAVRLPGSSHATPEPHETRSQPSRSPIHVVPNQGKASSEPPRTSPARLDTEEFSFTSQAPAAHEPDSIPPAKEPSQDQACTSDSHHEEDIAMVDGPTLVNESPAHHTSSQTSSRASSPSPFIGRSLQNYGRSISTYSAGQPLSNRISGRALSNRSFDNESSDRSVLHGVQAAGKIQKRCADARRRSWTPPETLKASTTGTAPDPEDLLKALTICYRNQKQQRAVSKAKEKDKENVIVELKMIITLLDDRLQDSNEQVSKQEAKLLEYRQLVRGWQEKVKKLSNFVKGLNNDHARLRDNARSIQEEQQNMKLHKDAIDKMLKEAVGALEKERLHHQERLLKAHHRTEIAEQALNARNTTLQDEKTRLQAERDRSLNLQDSLRQLASSREDIVVKLTDQEAAISSKIANLDQTIADAVRNASINRHDDPNPKLEECILLFKESQAVNPANAEKLQKLNMSVKKNGDKISQLASICRDNFDTTSAIGNKLLSEFGTRLQSLMSSIEAGRPLEQQMQDLCEAKATLAERLQATEVYVADSRRNLTAAEAQEKALLQKVAALEAELKTLRGQPQESTLMALRLHDSEKQCEKIDQQLSAYQVQLEDTKSDLASRYAEKADLEDSLQAARAEIAELQTKLDAVLFEKVAVEGESKLNEDRLKEHYSKICDDQVSRNTEKYVNEIHRLRNVEKDLNASRAEISLLQATKAEALANLDTAKRELEMRNTSADDGLQILQKCQHERAQLEQDLKCVRHQDSEKSKQLLQMETEIRQLREEALKVQRVQKDLEEHAQAEKASALKDVKAAEASANNSRQLLTQSRKEILRLNELVADLTKNLQHHRDIQPKIQEEVNLARAEFADIRNDLTKESEKVRQLRAQLDVAEADKRRLLAQEKALLNSPRPKSRGPEGHSGELVGEQSAMRARQMREATPTAKAAPKQRLTHTKKAVVVEDSQDRGSVVEESQQPDLPRLSSSDVLNSTNPVTYMPKVIQDLVAARSSPMTDLPPTPLPVTDAQPPPSRRGRVVEDFQAAGMSSQELGSSYGSPSQHGVWTLSKHTTTTKSKSVERSVVKTSQPLIGRMPQAHSGTAISPARSANSQAKQQPQGILKPTGLKRTASSQPQPGNYKRQRVSSQMSAGEGRSSSGIPRASPIRRKTRQSDKYHDKFTAELAKGKQKNSQQEESQLL
ncbi:MAG: hypothetical protein Q9221_003222 [Calogaya cf. arnoldii]